MQSVLELVIVTSLAFLGTMVDNFVVLATQLLASDERRTRRLCRAQALGIVVVVALAAALGSALNSLSLRWFAVLSLVPFAFAWRAWQRRRLSRDLARHGAIATLLVTVALGGDNLAVWLPLVSSRDVARVALVVAVLALWEVLFLGAARALAHHDAVVRWSDAHVARVTPVVYALVGVLVLVECRVLG